MPLIMTFTDKDRQAIRIREHSNGQRMCVMSGGRIGGRVLTVKIDQTRLVKGTK